MRTGQCRLHHLHHLEDGSLVGTAVQAHLAKQIGEFALVERDEIFVGRQLRVIFRCVREDVVWIALIVFINDGVVQFSHAHLAILVDLFRTVADIVFNEQWSRRDALESYRLEVADRDSFLHDMRQTDGQLPVLKEKELTAAVRRAHQQVVERLVILYQIGVDKLRWQRYSLVVNDDVFIISQILHAFDVGAYQGIDVVGLLAKRHLLALQDTRTKLLGHIGLAVLVDRHQFVHTEDAEFHVQFTAGRVTLQLRIHLVDVVVLAHVVLHAIHGLG